MFIAGFHMTMLQLLKYKIRIYFSCLYYEHSYQIVGTQECR